MSSNPSLADTATIDAPTPISIEPVTSWITLTEPVTFSLDGAPRPVFQLDEDQVSDDEDEGEYEGDAPATQPLPAEEDEGDGFVWERPSDYVGKRRAVETGPDYDTERVTEISGTFYAILGAVGLVFGLAAQVLAIAAPTRFAVVPVLAVSAVALVISGSLLTITFCPCLRR